LTPHEIVRQQSPERKPLDVKPKGVRPVRHLTRSVEIHRRRKGDLNGMSGKIAGVDTGSTGDMWATQNQQRLKMTDIRRYEGLSPAMLDLAAGRINGYVSDIPAVQYYIKDKPVYQVVERIPAGEQYSIMFAKNSPLAEKMNAEITKLKQEGFVAKLHEKWFGAKADPVTTTVKIVETI
jgi:polar amino acid transport system substrate-binding protein